jgi:hypothetical protein
VLGAWLGDGDSSGPTLTYHGEDQEIVERCEAAIGTAVKRLDRARPNVWRARFNAPTKLLENLRLLGVLKNKHVPEIYLRADADQRRALLAGLLDTDGTVSKKGGVEFDNMNERLADGVLELARSLGFKAHKTSASVRSPADGRDLGVSFSVRFQASYVVFSLARKRALQAKTIHGRAGYRSIVEILPVESTPTRCITVDSNDSTYVAGREYIVTHNTSSVSVGRALWELGKNTNLRIVVVSNTTGQAEKIVRSISRYIETSEELHEVFPNLRPGIPWTNRSITVERTHVLKDPSVAGYGVHGAVLGARIDLLILDDILDHENTRTEAQRNELLRWYRSTLGGRVTKDGRIIAVGTAWHPEDLMHILSSMGGWVSRRFGVQHKDGSPTWPERWPLDRIAAKREELGPLEASRQLDCRPVDEGSERFRDDWILRCKKEGLGFEVVERIRHPGLPVPRPGDPDPFADWPQMPENAFVSVGIDLGFTKKRGGAKTVFFPLLFYPDGKRQILKIKAGTFSGPEILAICGDIYQRFGATLWVESVGAQRLVLDFAADDPALAGVPVMPFQTGSNKWHPQFGVESLAVEMSRGDWIIPNDEQLLDPEIAAFITDLKSYNPLDHTGDYLMAAWIAREGGRGYYQPHAKGSVRIFSGVAQAPARGLGGERKRLVDPTQKYEPSNDQSFRDWLGVK